MEHHPRAGGYLYCYSLSGVNPTSLIPAISHFIIELSANVSASEILNPTFNGNSLNSSSLNVGTQSQNAGNPNLPMGVYGMKVEESASNVNFSFTINRMPVWGNFYAKGGPGSTAYNAGFTTTDGASGFFIARPDSVPVIVPLPPAVLGGLVLLGFAGLKVRSKF